MSATAVSAKWRDRLQAELERCFFRGDEEHRALRPEISTDAVLVEGEYPRLDPVIFFRCSMRPDRPIGFRYGEVSWLITSLEGTADDAEVAAHVVWANFEEFFAAVEQSVLSERGHGTIWMDTLSQQRPTGHEPWAMIERRMQATFQSPDDGYPLSQGSAYKYRKGLWILIVEDGNIRQDGKPMGLINFFPEGGEP